MKHTILTNIYLQWCTLVILGFTDITSFTSRRKTCSWIFKNLHLFLISSQFTFSLRNAKFIYVILFKAKIRKHLFIKQQQHNSDTVRLFVLEKQREKNMSFCTYPFHIFSKLTFSLTAMCVDCVLSNCCVVMVILQYLGPNVSLSSTCCLCSPCSLCRWCSFFKTVF